MQKLWNIAHHNWSEPKMRSSNCLFQQSKTQRYSMYSNAKQRKNKSEEELLNTVEEVGILNVETWLKWLISYQNSVFVCETTIIKDSPVSKLYSMFKFGEVQSWIQRVERFAGSEWKTETEKPNTTCMWAGSSCESSNLCLINHLQKWNQCCLEHLWHPEQGSNPQPSDCETAV